VKTFVAPQGFHASGAVFIEEDGLRRPLPLRLNEMNHSPTGFSWGYAGSGPAQLSYCLLRAVGLSPKDARWIYHLFKANVIQNLDRDQGWALSEEAILKWVRILQARKQRCE
jgi:hypothetical protein